MTRRSLTEILADMEAAAEGSEGDPEIAHARADDLLIETVRYLARGHSRTAKDMAEDVVTKWRDVEKWYA